MAHDEFPPLTAEAYKVLSAGIKATVCTDNPGGIHNQRTSTAAVIREAMEQASPDRLGSCKWDRLGAIANNLHALPPPPPTREQMEEALQHLIDMYGARVAGESTDEHLQTLRAGIAHHCKVQP